MMSCKWVVLGLALVVCCLQHVNSGGCPVTKPPAVPSIPSEVWTDVNLCPNQKITYVGKRCLDADRFTIYFLHGNDVVNPELDARFGYGGRYKYQANNYGGNGWGEEQVFGKKMELRPNEAFVMEIRIQHESIIEWLINGEYIGMYLMREGAKVGTIQKIGLNGCAAIDSVEFSTIV